MHKYENNPEERPVKPIRPRRAWVSTLLYIALLVSMVFAALQIHIYMNRRDAVEEPDASADGRVTSAHPAEFSIKDVSGRPETLLQKLGLRYVAAEPPVKPKRHWKKLQAMGRVSHMRKGFVDLNWIFISPESPETALQYGQKQLTAAGMKYYAKKSDEKSHEQIQTFGKNDELVTLKVTKIPAGSNISIVQHRKEQEGDFTSKPDVLPIIPTPRHQPAATYVAIRVKHDLKEGTTIRAEDIAPVELPVKEANTWPKPVAWGSRAAIMGRTPTARAIKAGAVLQWADFVPPNEIMDAVQDPDKEMMEIDDPMYDETDAESDSPNNNE